MDQNIVKIYVATHMPITFDLPGYCQKVQVNCAGQEKLWEGYFHDNEGDNISAKNCCYSELTVLYWAWKNSKADFKGLCHYRRYFSRSSNDTFIPIFKLNKNHLVKECLSESEISEKFRDGYEMILTKPYFPYPHTAREELEKYVYPSDIDAMIHVFDDHLPDYKDALSDVLCSFNLSYYNMFIAPDKLFHQYCEWLFRTLELIEECTDISQYDRQHQRLYGYLSEILLNVYVRKHNLKCCYYKMGFLDTRTAPINRLKLFLMQRRNDIHEYLYRRSAYGIIQILYRKLFRLEYKRLENFNSKYRYQQK